jgi:hypothetical protein
MLVVEVVEVVVLVYISGYTVQAHAQIPSMQRYRRAEDTAQRYGGIYH